MIGRQREIIIRGKYLQHFFTMLAVNCIDSMFLKYKEVFKTLECLNQLTYIGLCWFTIPCAILPSLDCFFPNLPKEGWASPSHNRTLYWQGENCFH